MLNSKGGQVVYETILGDILSGKLRPSERIPSRVDLIRRFKTTPVTVQRAFDRLVEAEFIESRGRKGTFVVSNLPNRHRIGLVFKKSPSSPEWRQFWTIMRQVSVELEGKEDWQFETYLEIEQVNSPGRTRLAYDIENHRLAGIFHIIPATRTEIPFAQDIPCVCVVTADDVRTEKALSILLDTRRFILDAVQYQVSRGCKKLAVIATPGFRRSLFPFFSEVLESFSLPLERKWIQTGNLNAPSESANLAELMFSGGMRKRPDGLLILDDNLTPHVCRGLAEIGLLPERDVTVVSHANYPSPSASAGVVRLGFDNAVILRSAVSYIQKCRDSGRLLTDLTVIPPVFECTSPSSV